MYKYLVLVHLYEHIYTYYISYILAHGTGHKKGLGSQRKTESRSPYFISIFDHSGDVNSSVEYASVEHASLACLCKRYILPVEQVNSTIPAATHRMPFHK